MIRTQRIQLVEEIAKQPSAFDALESQLGTISKDKLSGELLECGIIPEHFPHDSSEEKLWAKYCDILLGLAFNYLGIRAQVIRARGDSADVLGTADQYTIVADAKAFRLSRTAKNQKDFKVSALDDWRRQNTYACLVAPLYQYPTTSSQIYAQAEAKNVTLLSYVHLKFLLDFPPQKSLEPLWSAPGSVQSSKDCRMYWETIDDRVVALTNQSYERLRAYKRLEVDRTTQIGNEGVLYWESVVSNYRVLSREEAIQRLIQAEKIEQKIRVIQSALRRVKATYAD